MSKRRLGDNHQPGRLFIETVDDARTIRIADVRKLIVCASKALTSVLSLFPGAGWTTMPRALSTTMM